MILAVFLTSLFLTLFCWQRKHSWKERNDKSLQYFFFDKSFEFLMSLTVVTLFYTILWLLVNRTTDQTTLGWLETLEGVLDSIKSFITFTKLKPWTAALIIFTLIVIDLLISYFFRTSDIASRYKDYHKWSKRASIVVVLLCSFTFFGNQLGEQRAGLRLRTDNIKLGYAAIQEEAEGELNASVQQEIYVKVVASFPPEVKESLNYPKSLDDSLASLRSAYESARAYGIRDGHVVEVLQRYNDLARRTPNFADKPVSYEGPKSNQTARSGASKTPAQSSRAKLTVESVKKTLSNLDAKKTLRTRFVSLLRRDSSTQLVAQFPKSFTNVAKSVAFEALFKRYPFLEPVIDVFVGTFDKQVEEKVRLGANKVADALIENPEQAQQVITKEARNIADSVEVKVPKSMSEKATKHAGEMNRELNEIRAADQKISSSLEARRQQEVAIKEAADARQRQEIVECYCICSRDGIKRYQGRMAREQCESICSGPC